MDQLYNLKGRKALVTGSSRGIGKAIALELAKCGVSVIIHHVGSVVEAESVAKEARTYGVKSYAVKADLMHAMGPLRLYEKTMEFLGSVDILVLNASIQYSKSWKEVTHQDFEEQMNVNFRASLELIQRFEPSMEEHHWGRIITIGSVQQAKPHPDMIVYAASKAAQLSMVRNLAKQLAPEGITVNNMAPGVINTDRNTKALSDEGYYKNVVGNIPAGIIGNVEDCVGAVLLLCSEAGRYITGEDWFVDGGMHL